MISLEGRSLLVVGGSGISLPAAQLAAGRGAEVVIAEVDPTVRVTSRPRLM